MKQVRHSIVRNLLVSTVLTATLATFAQPKPEGLSQQTAPRFSERLQSVAARPGGGGIERVFAVLNEEQRKSFREANDGQRDKMLDLEKKAAAARKAVLDASIAEKLDEDALRAKVMDAAKIDAELAVLRAQAISKIQPPLSKEQIEKLKNPPAQDMRSGRESGAGRNFNPGDGGQQRGPRPAEGSGHKLPPPPKPQ